MSNHAEPSQRSFRTMWVDRPTHSVALDTAQRRAVPPRHDTHTTFGRHIDAPGDARRRWRRSASWPRSTAAPARRPRTLSPPSSPRCLLLLLLLLSLRQAASVAIARQSFGQDGPRCRSPAASERPSTPASRPAALLGRPPPPADSKPPSEADGGTISRQTACAHLAVRGGRGDANDDGRRCGRAEPMDMDPERIPAR